ncbi:MAG: B12-binding domain-containing radical SAM protein [Chitinophagales bacterium]|nr:B12-binding domain-containing radical SAM protein [Chitinophagales bacterium]MDW8417798.1 radical SAM protein [Chitinophagales bacterium]
MNSSTIWFLNLPAAIPVVRRYMCSSFAERYLFPPHDLLALAAVARAAGHRVVFTDAVAECIGIQQVIRLSETIRPDLVVSIMSFELFDKDVSAVKMLKQSMPDVPYILIGYYPTEFPHETLALTGADMVMLGEPDHVFENVLKYFSPRNLPEHITGTVVRKSTGDILANEPDRRVPNPNLLPMPAYDLIIPKHYKEPFMPNPVGVIQSARGCPYFCNYCVHSFGTKLTVLTPENTLEHILFMKKHLGVRSLRFIDDTFTAVPSRVIKLCRLMIEHKVNLPWTCLSRADTLYDEEMLLWMRKAGCIRLNIGFESGSQRILDILEKGYEIEKCIPHVKKARKMGFEILGFFLTGIPEETVEDIHYTLKMAKELCHFAIVDTLKIYPGTPLHNRYKHLLHFSLMPYKNEFTDPLLTQKATKHRKYIYRKFYFRPAQLFNFPLSIYTDASIKDTIPYVFKMVSRKVTM